MKKTKATDPVAFWVVKIWRLLVTCMEEEMSLWAPPALPLTHAVVVSVLEQASPVFRSVFTDLFSFCRQCFTFCHQGTSHLSRLPRLKPLMRLSGRGTSQVWEKQEDLLLVLKHVAGLTLVYKSSTVTTKSNPVHILCVPI